MMGNTIDRRFRGPTERRIWIFTTRGMRVELRVPDHRADLDAGMMGVWQLRNFGEVWNKVNR